MALHVRGRFFFFTLAATLLTALIHLLGSAESANLFRNETDRLAVLAFKDGISKDPNRALSSWNDSLHFCMWGGVTCGRRHPQRVRALNLTSQNLAGFLSPQIANLSFLRSIDLSFNNFQGHIPHELGLLFRLQHLKLRVNSFQGEIPSNLTRCLELRILNLDTNKLVGNIPPALSLLPKLDTLFLGKNNLSGRIPPSLGNLSSLSTLDLSKNSLEGSIPDSLGRLVNLRVFAVGVNKLSGTIPSSFYNLSTINVFDVPVNNLHGALPPTLGLSFPNLKWLSVGDNWLTGSLPNSLGNASGIWLISLDSNNFTGLMPTNLGRLQALKRFNVEKNQLSGDLSFIDSLTNCSKLEALSISVNKFSSVLPNSVANLSIQLVQIMLAENQIYGNIPVGIDNLANLIALGMGNNLLTGSIPNQLGNLKKLQGIGLSRNRLSGQIPESLGNLSQLTILSLQESGMKGNIPWSLGNCQRLEQLFLSANDLDGTIPEQILSIPSLVDLAVDMNFLVGSLPSNVDKLKNLLTLDVSNNKLSGEIPNTLGKCFSLKELYMEGNMFQGIIPSLSDLKEIQILDLSQNDLSGQIPKDLETLPNLQYLNLSFNDLEGEVPKAGVFQNPKAFSVVQNDKLCGGIPTLKLPPCLKQASSTKRRAFPLKLTIVIVVVCLGVLLLSTFLAIRYWLKRPSKKSSSALHVRDRFLGVTYADILKATDAFSSANLIGEGSYGSVYKGIIDHNDATVAIKVLKLQHQRASKSFIAECKALRSIQHRNIVKILTVCSSTDFLGNDFKAFIFEYMPNGNLDMWLHTNANDNQMRKLNFLQRLNIAIDVACALDYLHHHCEVPVVHCDLKPSNILLDNDMVAHVSDFGLARVLTEDLVQSRSLLVKGSIGYAAPEYGMGGDVSTSGDVYSYGILLLEMFMGKRPTDDIFQDNLSIHQFAKRALPGQVLEIVDHQLLLEESGTLTDDGNNKMRSDMDECLLALVSIGVCCSSKLPKERMDMKHVVRELHRVKELYLGVRKSQASTSATPFLVEGPSYLSHY